MAGPLYLLGPQGRSPTLPHVLSTVPGDGRVLCITAGWRNEEGDDEQLATDAGVESLTLPLYRWFEETVRDAPDLAEAYHARQREIRRLKTLYRLRLGPALDAVRSLRGSSESTWMRNLEIDDALDAVRRLDTRLVDTADDIRRKFVLEWRPLQHPLVQARHEQIGRWLDGARAVLLAGGHVGVLRNRLEFFGLGPLLSDANANGTAIIAWSAGAMALCDRVVLFHDDPPVGLHDAEILDRGLGLAPDVVLFPHARERLWLDDEDRVALMASRFLPIPCIGLENGAWLERELESWVNRGPADSALRMLADGRVEPFGEGA